jgi:hypothetical protein
MPAARACEIFVADLEILEREERRADHDDAAFTMTLQQLKRRSALTYLKEVSGFLCNARAA